MTQSSCINLWRSQACWARGWFDKLILRKPIQTLLWTDPPELYGILPEYVVEVILDYLSFSVWTFPDKYESISAKTDLLHFILVFLTSTQYIPNLALKWKLSHVLFLSIWAYHREADGVLGLSLNKHPLALKHLMFALTQIYMDVDQRSPQRIGLNSLLAGTSQRHSKLSGTTQLI